MSFLSGAATVKELESNLAARALDPAPLEQSHTLCEDPDTYWQTRAALPWN